MTRGFIGRLLLPSIAAVGVSLLLAGSASAGGGSYGSSGGWGYGSSGGSSGGWSSSGSYNSSGGGLLSRIRHNVAYRRAARRAALKKSWYSSGGSSGGHYSSGGYARTSYFSSGGASSGGSSGGTYYSVPVRSYGSTGSSHGSSGGSMSYSAPMMLSKKLETGDAILAVSVPEDAKIYVNDKLTKTPGTSRQFVSRNLQDGETYTYEVRAEVVREGQVVAQTKVIDLTAGIEKAIAFDFSSAAPVVTTVTLNVPEDAVVKLGGVETEMSGAKRVFSTTQLPVGKSWEDYQVVVEVERNGKVLQDVRVLDIAAGETKELSFDFAEGESFVSLEK